jgi:glycosyltransferase involved in cell wall biosynthesis
LGDAGKTWTVATQRACYRFVRSRGIEASLKPLKDRLVSDFGAQARVEIARSKGEHRVAFVFSGTIKYPPDIHNIKAHYLTEEMKRRGNRVDWVQIGGPEKRWNKDGISFSVLRAPKRGLWPEALQLLRLVLFCVVERVELVYEDEWLFLRKRPLARLVGQMILRRIGVKVVLDERDPYVDWEIASGKVKEGTGEHRRLSMMRSLLLRQTDLIILPSEAYAVLYKSEGIPEKKVFGIFRGIDQNLFEPKARSEDTRSKLGLDGDFVIGWFGMMHPYRMVREIIVPTIKNLSREMPNAHVLIGGEGPMIGEFERLRNSEARNSFSMLGTIPYTELPEYIAACDVTICPVNTDFRFSNYSNWLKIAESVAVGTPLIATRTEIAKRDFRDMKGVLWVGPDYPSFLRALKTIREHSESWRAEAEEQARHFEAYSIASTIPKIVDRVVALVQTG